MSPVATPRSASSRPTHAASLLGSGALAFAIGLPVVVFAMTGRYDLSLMDEGFLWYGAQRVRAGELPVLDFQSYDIGRYYWSAFWMWLAGSDGILPVRAGNAVLGSITVAIAVALVRAGSGRTLWRLIAVACLLTLWMVPDFKIADNFAAVALVAGLAGWLHRPSDWRRAAACGLSLGLAATIGINHGLYGTVALGLALAWHRWAGGGPLGGRVFAGLALGTVAGYLPVLACHVGVAGFTAAFVDSIHQIVEAGTTNLTRPPPRLWAVFDFAEGSAGSAVRESFLAAWVIAAAAFWLYATRQLLARPPAGQRAPAPVFAAALIVSLPYAHYAVSRLDMVHVAVWVPPLLIACFTRPAHGAGSAPAPGPGPGRTALSWIALGWIGLASGILLAPEQRGYRALRGAPHETIDLQGERLHLSTDTAAEIAWLSDLTRAHAGGDRTFFAAPYRPGAYAAMRRRSPVWEIYALFPSTPARQHREIGRLAVAEPGFAVVSDGTIDGRADLGFARTHPIVTDHLRSCFVPTAPSASAPEGTRIFLAPSRGSVPNAPRAEELSCRPTLPHPMPRR